MPPVLVQMLAGNAVTAVSVLACLKTADSIALRRLHPVLAAAVEAVPWADSHTQVHDTGRWRAALPAATTLKLAAKAPLRRDRALAALSGVTVLDLAGCRGITDATIARLPPTLRVLNVSDCTKVTEAASFLHLPTLESLDCSSTDAVTAGLACLPPSLRTLRMYDCELPDTADFSHLWHLCEVTCGGGPDELSSASAASLPPSLEVLDVSDVYYHNNNEVWPPGWSLVHLTRLRELNAAWTAMGDAAIASLPPTLLVLNLQCCDKLSPAASFAHLTCLHTLNFRATLISSAALATLPPSLVSLDLHSYKCKKEVVAPAIVFPDLPALRVLDVSDTDICDEAVASMPAGLEELRIICCSNVTQRASLDHLAALRVLQSVGTDLSRVTIEACRARGCFAPADGKLALEGGRTVDLLVPLPDGRLVSGTREGHVALWEVAAGSGAVVAELELHGSSVRALAVLNDGHRVAVGGNNGVVMWDTHEAPHDKRVVTGATIALPSGVAALAVAPSGWLVAGCEDGKLRMVDVGAGAVATTLAAHDTPVRVVAVLLDGRVASVSKGQRAVALWDVETGACVATLVGHTCDVTALAVLADGRLASASGSWNATVWLWDVTSGTCICVLPGDTISVVKLAVLPGDQLASLSARGKIHVWDTREDACGAGGTRVIEISRYSAPLALAPLPGNRLATGGNDGVYLWQLPSPTGTDSDTGTSL